MLASAEDITF